MGQSKWLIHSKDGGKNPPPQKAKQKAEKDNKEKMHTRKEAERM